MTDPIRRQDRFFGTAIASATPHDLVHKVSNAENRIASLDGLRAIAILAVALGLSEISCLRHNMSPRSEYATQTEIQTGRFAGHPC